MRGEAAQGDDALTAEEQALLDADRNNAAPAEELASAPDAVEEQADATDQAAEGDGGEEQQSAKQKPPPGTVPHQALHEERRLRQEAEKQREEERKRATLLEERMNLLLRQMQPQQPQQQPAQPQAPAIPELDKDPVGHLLGQIQQRDQILQALVQAAAGQSQQSQQAQAVATVASRASAMEQEFAAQNPDYQQAYEHLIDGRRRELMAAGWSDPAEIKTFMANEAYQLAANAIQRGMNPASVVYELAKIRGWQPKSAETATETPPQPDPAAVEQINNIARGQQQARGINRVPGQATAPVNATAIANMSEDEFAAWMKKATPSDRRRVLGA